MVEKTPSIKINTAIPEFMLCDSPQLSKFIEYYYEWLEGFDNAIYHQRRIIDYSNVNITEDIFFDFLKKEFLNCFGDISSNINERTLLKNIKDFYRSKGSEKALRLLFRIFFDEEVDFYYPGQDILRASHGNWVVERSIRVSFNETDINYVGTTLSSTQNPSFTVERQVSFIEDGVRVTELFLRNVFDGPIETGDELFSNNDIIGTVTGDLFVSEGRYEGTNGFLSSDKFIQDSNFYQEFSYVIQSNRSVIDYGDIVDKTAHPLGSKRFGSLNITTNFELNNNFTLETEYDVFSDIDFSISISNDAEMSDAGLFGKYIYEFLIDVERNDPTLGDTWLSSETNLISFSSDKYNDYENVLYQDMENIPYLALGDDNIFFTDNNISDINAELIVTEFSNIPRIQNINSSLLMVNDVSLYFGINGLLRKDYDYNVEQDSKIKTFAGVYGKYIITEPVEFNSFSDIITTVNSSFDNIFPGDIIIADNNGNSENYIVKEVIDSNNIKLVETLQESFTSNNTNFYNSGIKN